MRHGERSQTFTRWEGTERDVTNALLEAIPKMPSGQMMVYFHGRAGFVPEHVRRAARRAASQLGLAMVQWPTASVATGGADRLWCYAIQTPTEGPSQ